MRFEPQSWYVAQFDALILCAKLQVNTFSSTIESEGIEKFIPIILVDLFCLSLLELNLFYFVPCLMIFVGFVGFVTFSMSDGQQMFDVMKSS